jgi:hypothetical protein
MFRIESKVDAKSLEYKEIFRRFKDKEGYKARGSSSSQEGRTFSSFRVRKFLAGYHVFIGSFFSKRTLGGQKVVHIWVTRKGYTSNSV